MTYRLWLGDLDCGVAADQNATNWRDAMREHGYEGVRIEPDPDAEPTFPVGDEDFEQADLVSSVATARCPHCQATISFPGFDTMLAFICPQCGTSVKATLPVQ
jgi:hypothetical protein